MRKVVSALLVLIITFCLIGCGSENKSVNKKELGNVATEKVKIDSLDKLNFYAVKKAISDNNVTLLSDTQGNSTIAKTTDNKNFRLSNLSGMMDKNFTFTITMYSYFTVTLSDSNGFLAQMLGGTGSVEVVITHNNFNNMITFKKGDRYYSCLQSSLTENAMSFSTHRSVEGFKVIENYEQENYEYVVYFDGDRVIGMNCGRFDADGTSFRYTPDPITYNNNFSFVIYKKQAYTAEQLENLFSLNNSFVNDGVVLEDGSVLYGECSVGDSPIYFKNGFGKTIITNTDIEKINAVYNSKFGYCIKLKLVSDSKISARTTLSLYLNDAKDRDLVFEKYGSEIYITELENKSRMSDVFYKLTSVNSNNKIGKIIDYSNFAREISKKVNLNDYNLIKKDYSESFDNGLRIVKYTYDLKTYKSISYKASNYDITIDGITVTLPIKVSDFLNKGFTVEDVNFDNYVLQGGPIFKTPSGNKVYSFVMNFYGDSINFNDCYITQISFMCYENTVRYQEGISPTRPDFEMIEGINKDSTLDDIISRLGEPNKIILITTDNQPMNYKDCVIQLYYKVTTPSLPNGELVFNVRPVLNNNTPSDFLTDISFALQ